MGPVFAWDPFAPCDPFTPGPFTAIWDPFTPVRHLVGGLAVVYAGFAHSEALKKGKEERERNE